MNVHLTTPEMEQGLLALTVLGAAAIGLLVAAAFARVSVRLLRQRWRSFRQRRRKTAAYARQAQLPPRRAGQALPKAVPGKQPGRLPRRRRTAVTVSAG